MTIALFIFLLEMSCGDSQEHLISISMIEVDEVSLKSAIFIVGVLTKHLSLILIEIYGEKVLVSWGTNCCY